MKHFKKVTTKVKLHACTKEIQKEVLTNMKFVGWNETIDGDRADIIVTFKDGKFYGYGLV